MLTAPYVLEYTYRRSVGPVVGAFLTTLRDQGRILGARTASGRVICPPTAYDPDTGEDIVDMVPVGPGGVVTTWSWVAEPRQGQPSDRPFAYALIKLDGADTAMLHAVEVSDPSEMATGMRVTAKLRPERSGTILDIEGFVPGDVDEPTEQTSEKPVRSISSPVHLRFTIAAGKEPSRFLQGLVERKFIGRRAPSGKVYVPPKGADPTTGEPTVEDVEVADCGIVTTFCVINFPFEGQKLEPPYAAGAILLDGSDVPLFHLIGGVDVAEIRMGMRVRAVWGEPAPTLESIRYFEPTGEPDAPFADYEDHL